MNFEKEAPTQTFTYLRVTSHDVVDGCCSYGDLCGEPLASYADV